MRACDVKVRFKQKAIAVFLRGMLSSRPEREREGERRMDAQEGGGGEKEISSCLITLSVEHCSPPFDLEKAVCSHGLFMMAPNLWLPSSKTLQRPLSLVHSSNTKAKASVIVRITHHAPSSSLHIWVLGLSSFALSLEDRHAIKAQVTRMLRLSEDEDKKIFEFHKIHKAARDSGFGRIFRSPTLFEDMVKCILLCNTGWGRTLSMARSLCEFQFELQDAPLGWSTAETAYCNEACLKVDGIDPDTPEQKESKRKNGNESDLVANVTNKFAKNQYGMAVNVNMTDSIPANLSRSDLASTVEHSFAVCLTMDQSLNRQRTSEMKLKIGNFPSPEELASLDERFLAERCGVGYRAKRILELAKRVVEHRLLEVLEDREKITEYDVLTQKLLDINGFGMFTTVNVLVCIGFYHKIPADSETVRHLKQFHSKNLCKAGNVEECAEQVYDIYAPFQFLAYWYEVWASYEKRFGKMSEMKYSCYRFITGHNMRDKPLKRTRTTKKKPTNKQ